VVAWGKNGEGQCNVPTLPSGLRYESVAGGAYHGLAVIREFDCNQNGIDDRIDIVNGATDCDANRHLDVCDLANGFVPDCNFNNIPDTCDVAAGAPDCNLNHSPDSCDLGSGISNDADFNSIPDECSLDCNNNGLLDTAEVFAGISPDCNANQRPDSCDLASGVPDCNQNGVPDSCDVTTGGQDCNANGQPDACDVAGGASDCNGNQRPDSCDLAAGAADCDANLVIDSCQLAGGAPDCNGNGTLDSCDMASGTPDCDGDLVPDACETDANANGVPDNCEMGGTPYCFGTGPSTGGVACPCGNIGTTGNGCPNSQNPNGARLEAMGLPSRSADSLVLNGSGMPPVATMLYFQGTSQSNGVLLGDGLRCATGITVRLGYRTNVNGASQWPPAGGVPISIGGQIPATGLVTRYYQGWYRDAAPSFCTTNRYNLTNGVAVVWVP
jgi:hypothetical protein